jgi:hypothetical protein
VKVRISRQDAEFSRLIRERDKWRCRKCGRQYAPGDRGLHCAHIVGRGNKELRYDERNAISLCYRDHLFWAHSNPIAFVDWVKDEIGVKTYNWLRRVAATPKKVRNTQRHA